MPSRILAAVEQMSVPSATFVLACKDMHILLPVKSYDIVFFDCYRKHQWKMGVVICEGCILGDLSNLATTSTSSGTPFAPAGIAM